VVVLVILLLLLLLSLEERRNGKGKLEEASDKGQGPRKAVEPVIMVMMTTTVITIVVAVIFWKNVLQVQSLIVIILNLLNIITERCGRVVNAPASYLGDPGFQISAILTGFLWFSSISPGKCQDGILN
jgi:ABC-type sugar transport system permease subunit